MGWEPHTIPAQSLRQIQNSVRILLKNFNPEAYLNTFGTVKMISQFTVLINGARKKSTLTIIKDYYSANSNNIMTTKGMIFIFQVILDNMMQSKN